MPEAAIIPPAATITQGTEDSGLLDSMRDRLKIQPAATENTPASTDDTGKGETPPAEPAKVEDPKKGEPVKPDDQKKQDNAAFAAKRVQEKTASAELEQAKAKIAELEALAAKYPELESSLVEQKTLAEQRAAELKTYQERYRNETDKLEPELLMESPVVQKAQTKYNEVAGNLFPRDLSNPSDDEASLSFDPGSLEAGKAQTVVQMIDLWEREEFDAKGSPQRRSDVKHVLISNIAAAIGVDSSKFNTKVIDGKEYAVIPPSHPVYRHLESNMRPFVQARREWNSARESVLSDRETALQPIISTRVANTKKMFADTGVGLSGEPLKAALAKTPDSPILQAMSMIEGDEALMKELQENMEVEAAVNGHFRPQLDLVEKDIGARNKSAGTFMTRIGARAIHAPLAPVLLKLTAKQNAELTALREEIAAVKAERDKFLIQGEPGGGDTSGPQSKPALSNLTDAERRIAEKYGLGKA